MALQNIIFDLDGTLIDSARLTGLVIDQMLAERATGVVSDPDMIRAMDALGGEAMIAAVMGTHSTNPADDLEDFRARFLQIVVPRDLSFPGVVDGLEALRRSGGKLAICSNKPQNLCDKILCALGLEHHFVGVVGSDPARPKKPAPDAAILALQALGGNRAGTLYCGDSYIDVLTARAAGMPVVMVDWGYGTAEALALEPGLPRIGTMESLVEALHGEGDLAPFFYG